MDSVKMVVVEALEKLLGLVKALVVTLRLSVAGLLQKLLDKVVP